ncbi:MAG: immunoglobulin domain-containing protein [Verrucomicrobia bacterium]|nr:immunoglobulin domain-containing protein [Verrucomicrobiota bacterium]
MKIICVSHWLLVATAAAGSLAAAGPLTAATVAWVGPHTGEQPWAAATNWSTGAVPGPSDDVVVDGADTNLTLVLASPCTVRSLVNRATLWVHGRHDGGNARLATTADSTNHGVIRLESSNAAYESLLVVSTNFVNAAGGFVLSRAGSGGSRQVSGHFINQGVVQGDAYPLDLQGTFEAAGGTIAGPVRLRGASVRVTASPAAPVTLDLWGACTLWTDNLSNTVLWVHGNNPGGSGVLSAAGTFTNHGTIRLESTDAGHAGILNVTGALVNASSGVLEINAGSGGSRTVSAELCNAGVVTCNCPVALGRAGAEHRNTGMFRVNATTVTLAGSSFWNEAHGELSGAGTFGGAGLHFQNSGLVSPGASAGLLTLTGDYTQTADGRLAVEIGGLAAGAEHDRLAISGRAALSGGLSVSVSNTFVPALSNAFSVVTFGSLAGQFSSWEGLALGADLVLQPVYYATRLDLRADSLTNAPGVAPTILAQPSAQVVPPGGSATLCVTANGSFPLSYQWRHDATNVAGATQASLILADVTPDQAGNYQVVITNLYGSITSAVAHLTVIGPTNVAHWDGGGDGVSWQDPANWTTGVVPGADDSAVIDLPAGASVVSRSNVTVRTVQCACDLLITNSDFTVTASNSWVNGSLTVAPGRRLTASGTAIFTGNGPAWIGGAHLAASNGGRLELPQATSFTSGQLTLDGGATVALPALTNVDLTCFALSGGAVFALPASVTRYSSSGGMGMNEKRTIMAAAGTGTRLDLSSLTVLTAQFSGWGGLLQLVTATGGGEIDLSGVQAITAGGSGINGGGPLELRADAASVIRLDSLTQFNGVNAGIHMNCATPGVDLPQLRSAVLTRFALPAGGILDAPLLGSIETCRLTIPNGARFAAGALTNCYNGTLELSGAGVLEHGTLASIDSSRFLLSGGATFVLPPSVTSYVPTVNLAMNEQRTLFSAAGAGTRLDLSSLTNMEVLFSAWGTLRCLATASAGGEIDCSGLRTITGGGSGVNGGGPLEFRTDASSRISLPALEQVTGSGAGVLFTIGGASRLGAGPLPVTNTKVTTAAGSSVKVATLELLEGSTLSGSGTIEGHVLNASAVQPGTSAGLLTVHGDYTQTAAGTLFAEIGGPAAGTQFDQLAVAGVARLDGVLDVRRINNYVPSLTHVFRVLACGSRSGEFVSLAGADAGGGIAFTAAHLADGVVLATHFSSGPSVVAASPSGVVGHTFNQFVLVFSETLTAGSFTAADVAFTGPGGAISVNAPQWLSNATWRISFAAQTNPGSYLLAVGPGVTDPAGNPMNQDGDLANGEAGEDAFVLETTLPPPADLIVADLQAPPAAVVGALIQVAWTVTNQGAHAVQAPRSDALYLSGDRAIGNDILLGHFAAPGLLGAGEAHTVTNRIIVPTNFSGACHFVVMADSLLQNFEADMETNNTFLATNAIVISSPDLQIDRLTVVPGTARFGDAILVQWTVRNAGSATAGGVWRDALYLSPTPTLSTQSVVLTGNATTGGPLGAGASCTNSATVTLPLRAGWMSGDYHLVAFADANRAQPEADEANNTASAVISLTLPPLPDLRMGEVLAPDTGTPGKTAAVVWSVTNAGTAAVAGTWRESVALWSTGAVGGDTLLASLVFTNDSLPPGAWLARTQEVMLPFTSPTGHLHFRVVADTGEEVVESDETNNAGVATHSTLLPAMLNLQLPVVEITEGAPPVSGWLWRNGDLGAPLVVSLSNDAPAALACTNQVVIPAQHASAAFEIRALADGAPGGNSLVSLVARAEGYQNGGALVTVLDADLPRLTLWLDAPTVPEGLAASASVTRDLVTSNEVVVFLRSSDPARVQVPATLTLAPGAASADFQVLPVDDAWPDLTRAYALTASATGFEDGVASLMVLDNDLPAVRLTLAATQVSEGAGPLATTATLVREPSTSRALTLELESTQPDVALVPARVAIAPYETAVAFPVAAVNNEAVDGSKTTFIGAWVIDPVSGHRLAEVAGEWLTVSDDDGPALAVTLGRTLVAEGRTAATTATVTRNTGTAGSLTVQLTSSDPTEATVPAAVIIPDGLDAVSCDVSTVNDGVTDGTRPVMIGAHAGGFVSGSSLLQVSDVDLPDLVVSIGSVPASADTESYVNLTYRIENQGLVAASNAWSTRVLRSDDPVLGDDVLVGNYAFSGAIQPGLYFQQTVPVRMPQAAGAYYLVIQTDVGNQVAETLEDNNTAVSPAPVQVRRAYQAAVQTDLDIAPAGTPVPLYGRAFRDTPDHPAPEGSLVNIHIAVRDTVRVIAALAGPDGGFTALWHPLPGEAGLYTIGAAHPGDAAAPVQDSFTLAGMKATPASPAVKVIEGTWVTNVLRIENLSDIPLSGLAAETVAAAANLEIAAALASEALDGYGSTLLTLAMTAQGTSPAQSSNHVRVTSLEGALLDVPLSVTVESLSPRLAASPGELNAGMLRGGQAAVEFDLANLGGAATGPLTVVAPAAAWFSVASTNPLASLGPGESNRVVLVLTPPADLPFGEYRGALAVDGAGCSLTVPFNFRALSEATGDLRVIAADEFTYYAEGAPRVAGAVVTVVDAVTGQAVTNGLTDSQGEFRAEGLREGYYDITVQAEKHAAYRGATLLKPGVTSDVQAFLSRQTVQYVWTVTKTVVEDRTRVSIETVFETAVPMPVVTLEPQVIDLADVTADVSQVDLKISNHGLIAASGFSLHFDSHPDWELKPLISEVGTLPPQSSLTVPVTIRRLQAAPAATVAARSGGGGCSIGARGCWSLVCGQTRNYCTPLQVLNAASGCGGLGGFVFSNAGAGGAHMNWPSLGGSVNCQTNQCNDPNFVQSCTELTYGMSVFESVAQYLKSFLESSPWFDDLEIKLSGGPQVCTCCDTGGEGWQIEGGLKLEIAAKFKYFLAGGEFKKAWSENGFDVEFKAVTGCPIRTGVNFSGYVKGSTVCHLEKPNVCGGVQLNLPLSFSCEVGGEISFKKNGQLVGKQGLMALAKIATGFTGKYEYCSSTGGAGQICWDGVKVSAGVECAFGGFNFNQNFTAEVAKPQCLPESPAQGLELEKQIIDDLERRGQWSTPDAWLKSPGVYLAAAALPASLTGATPAAAPGGDAICAQVRLQLDQSLVMARNAFQARLELSNRSGTSTLSNLHVFLTVLDTRRQSAADLFGIREPELSGLSAIDGTGQLAPETAGWVAWTLIPTSEAAPETETVYYVGGVMQFDLEGRSVAIPLTPAPITVHPDPKLVLKYFHQRDVFSDDPWTETVEPSIPYSLAAMVRNAGKGAATNVRITSAQPTVLDNQKGLLVDFKVLATEVAGRNLVPSLTAAFGDIGPGEIRIGRWLLVSSLQGLFVDYQASFEHLDGVTGKNLSLVDEVTIHEMIRLVQAQGAWEDGKPDFLVNDLPDAHDDPDTLYLSDGTTNPVQVVTAAAVTGSLSPTQLSVQIAAAAPDGWMYLRVPDPGGGEYRLRRVVRSDGMVIGLGTNVWTTDRTFVGLGLPPVREAVLHLLDNCSSGAYTLEYTPVPAPDTAPPSSAVAALPADSFEQILLQWSGTDAGGSGVAWYDLYVSVNDGAFTRWLEHARETAAFYPGAVGGTYAFYTVATDQAGNTEAPPTTPDATTRITLVNTAPSLTPGPDQAVDEGALVQIDNAAADAEAPPQTLTFSLGPGSPPGAVIHPTSGHITWQTGEHTGPGTHGFTVIVADSGWPALSATGQVTVVVREVNAPPSLAAVASQEIGENELLSITNAASDPDIPANALRFSLGPEAPPGAAIDPGTGIFLWEPTDTQGPSTNTISVVVTDNGSPPLSCTRTFTVVVHDTLSDFSVSLGSTNVFCGESNAVPVLLRSGPDLGEFTAVLEVPETRLTNLVLHSEPGEVASSLLVPLDARRLLLSVGLDGGASAQSGPRLVAHLGFVAVSNLPSAIAPLKLAGLLGTRLGGQVVSNGWAGNGRVIVVGQEPVLTAAAPPAATLYGKPGATYAVEYATNLVRPILWHALTNVTLDQRCAVLPGLPGDSPFLFLRAASVNAQPTLSLQKMSGAVFGFLLCGRAGGQYAILSTTNLGIPLEWPDRMDVTLTNACQTFSWTNQGDHQRFFRARQR